MNNLPPVIIVLCDTRFAGNIGSSARAMKVMGLNDLYLVNPVANVSDEDVKKMATFADDLVDRIKVFNNLEEIIQPNDFVVGFSVRNREVGPQACSLPFMMDYIRPAARVLLVFGSEQFGLSNNQLALCDLQCSIPTFHDTCSSLNLSHAVSLVTYHVATNSHVLKKDETDQEELSPQEHRIFDDFISSLVDKVGLRGFCDRTTPERTKRRLQILLKRAIHSRHERDFMFGFLKALMSESK